jgi:hypothetical protein
MSTLAGSGAGSFSGPQAGRQNSARALAGSSRAGSAGAFAVFDADGDGKLIPAEIRSGQEKLQQRRGRTH